jgi:predicted MFS family arabinose efflux permease
LAHVAGDEHLTRASSIIATGTNVGKTAGRLVAGALVASLGVTSVFVLDAITFAISAWLIASIRRGFSAARPLTEPAPTEAEIATMSAAPVRSPARSGVRFVLEQRTLRLLTMSACISVFATAFTMTAEVPLVFEMGIGALGLGALTASWGVGMVLGSWLGGRALHHGNEATGVLAGRLAMAAGVGLVATAPSLAPLLACYLLGGAGGGFMGVAAGSLLLRETPDHLRAQMLGAVEMLRNVAFGLGVVGAGAAVTLAGARPVYAAVGVTMALGTLPVAMLVVRLGGPRRLRQPAFAT